MFKPHQLLGVAFITLFSFTTFAAIPKQKTETESVITARELLALPELNRYQVAKGREDQLYPGMLEIAKNEKNSMSLRWKAVTLAGKLKGKDSIKDLRSFLNSKDWFMRNAALITLDSVSRADGLSAAKILLNDKALVVRSAAVQVLSQNIESRVTRDMLWEEISHDRNFRNLQSLWIRPQILKALAANPDKKELPLFIKHLEDKDGKVQTAAIEALETLSQKKMGQDRDSIATKRDLWKKWARSAEAANL